MRLIEQGDERRVVWSASDLKAAAECEFAWLRRIDAKLGRVPEVVEPEDETLARAGRLGTAVTLVTSADAKAVAAIEKLIGKAIPKADAGPAGEDDVVESHEAERERPAPAQRRERGVDAQLGEHREQHQRRGDQACTPLVGAALHGPQRRERQEQFTHDTGICSYAHYD